jgi:hypothetical protein
MTFSREVRMRAMRGILVQDAEKLLDEAFDDLELALDRLVKAHGAYLEARDLLSLLQQSQEQNEAQSPQDDAARPGP